MKVEIELPEIEGFEYTGAFMLPLSGEYFVYDAEGHSVVFAEEDHINRRGFILRKIKQYRELTPLEAMKAIVENGGPIQCEVDVVERGGRSTWTPSRLLGASLKNGQSYWFHTNNNSYQRCRIEV